MDFLLTRKGKRYLNSLLDKIGKGLLGPSIELNDWKALVLLGINERIGSEQITDIIERPYNDEEALEDSVEARQTVRRLFEAGYIESVK